MTYRHISAVLHGQYGSGKSYVASTIPGPTLYLDAEGGIKDVDKPQIIWEDPDKAPPECPKDTLLVVRVKEWDTAERALQWLWAGKLKVESVVIDSLSELSRQFIDSQAGYGESLSSYQQWGNLLNTMRRTVRRLRDKVDDPDNPINVVIVCSSDAPDEGKATFLMQGQFKKELSGYFDLVGYVTSDYDNNGDFCQNMQLNSDHVAEAKCRLKAVKKAHGKFMPIAEDSEPLRDIVKLVNTKKGND